MQDTQQKLIVMEKKIVLSCLTTILFCISELHAGPYKDITINGITYSIISISGYDNTGRAVVSKGCNYATVEIPDAITYPIQYEEDKICVVEGISSGAFAECDRLTSIALPPHLTKIGTKAFYKCSKLQTINLDSIRQIKSRAFDKCTALRSVKLGEKTEIIDLFAFNDCASIDKISIPANCERIESSAFFQCTQLKEITVTPNNKHSYQSINGILYKTNKEQSELLDLVIYPAGLENDRYVVPENVCYVQSHSFSGNKYLKRIRLSDNTQITGYSIFNCINLEKFELSPGNTKYFLTDGFLILEEGHQLTAVPNASSGKRMPDTIRKIAGGAYAGCTLLTNISISETVYEIESGIFYFCPNLKEVSLFNKSAGNNVYKIFAGIGASTSDQSDYWGDIFEDFNYYYQQTPYSYECYSPKNLKITLEDETISKIEMGDMKLTAFCVPHLKDISPITRVLYDRRPTIEHVDIGNAETLPERIFQGFTNLKEIIIPFPGAGNKTTAKNLGTLFGTSSTEGLKAVIQYFENGKTSTYNVPAGLEKITLAEGCQDMQYGALSGFSMLRELTLPASLYIIGEKALYGCAGLTDIYNKGADPAGAFDNSFTGVRTTTCKLHVPQNSKSLYEVSEGWKNFYYIQEEAPVKINVAKNIENAGTVLGIEEYQTNDVAELKAYPNSGYKFVAWTENGQIVSNDYIYNFTVTNDRSLIAVFVPVLNDNDVDVSVGDSRINFTWQAEEGARRYTLTIYADASMTEIIKSVSFDENGNVINGRSSGANTFTYTIDRLATADYYYTLNTYGESDIILSQRAGNCTVVSTGIYEMNNENIIFDVEGNKLCISNIQGLPVVVYTPQGIAIATRNKTDEKETFLLEQGLYIVRIGNKSKKILIQ